MSELQALVDRLLATPEGRAADLAALTLVRPDLLAQLHASAAAHGGTTELQIQLSGPALSEAYKRALCGLGDLYATAASRLAPADRKFSFTFAVTAPDQITGTFTPITFQ